MSGIQRITEPTLDVVEYLLTSLSNGTDEVHGWVIMKAVKRSGPTVYGVLDRLEEAGWISSRWDEDSEPGKPRRRLYKVTPNGRISGLELLNERRPRRTRVSRKPGFALFGAVSRGCIDGLRGGA